MLMTEVLIQEAAEMAKSQVAVHEQMNMCPQYWKDVLNSNKELFDTSKDWYGGVGDGSEFGEPTHQHMIEEFPWSSWESPTGHEVASFGGDLVHDTELLRVKAERGICFDMLWIGHAQVWQTRATNELEKEIVGTRAYGKDIDAVMSWTYQQVKENLL